MPAWPGVADLGKVLRLLVAGAALLTGAGAAGTEPFARVVIERVSDGDTLTVAKADGTRMKVRLSGIDAPERNQPYGGEARLTLERLLAGREITLDCMKTDRYGRSICRVFADGTDASLEMLKSGAAWWYRSYAHEQPPAERRAYADAEQNARKGAAGLWQTSSPVAPWHWRKTARH